MTAAIAFPAAAKDSDPLPKVTEFSLADAKGQRQTLADWRGRKAVVLIFLGTECPVSNGYAPTVVRLAKSYEEKGVAFYGVHPDPDVTAEAARKHASEYKLSGEGIRMPLLHDPRQALARQTGVTRVPECVVLSAAGQVLYRGRIDDRYSLDGRRRQEPTTKDLENAIEAVLRGNSPDPPTTKAFGCPLPPPER
jgi:peroxiredoxin